VARSPRKEAAWRWLAFLAEPEQQAAFHRLSGDLPARRAAWDAGLRGDAKAAAFLAQLEHLRRAPKIPEWERIASLDRETDRLLEKRRWLLARSASRR
jgi:multiple sugar transport system substrate-binding protein